jgi:hypothetical protein
MYGGGVKPMSKTNPKRFRQAMSICVGAALVFGAHSALPAKAKKKDEVKSVTLTYAHFQRLDRGMDEAQVIAILGRPIGITRPDYMAKLAVTKDWKMDPTAICFVYRGVIGPQHTSYNEDEWLVAFLHGKAVFWDKQPSSDCVDFFD